jgi:hypothetical protein
MWSGKKSMKLPSVRSHIKIPALLLMSVAVLSLMLGGSFKAASGQQVGEFLVSVSPSRLTIGTDGVGRFSVKITSINGFAGTIKLDITDLNAGGARTSFSFQPSIVQLAMDSEVYAVLTMTAMYEYSQYYYSYANLATVDFKITATSGGMVRSMPLTTDVIYGAAASVERTDVKVNLSPDTIYTTGDISQGKSQTVKIALIPKYAISDDLLFTTTPQFYDLPGGLYVSFDPVSLDIRGGRTSMVTANIVMTPEFLEKSGTHRLVVGISGLVTGTMLGASTYQDIFVTKTAILTIVIPPFFNVAIRPSILDVYIGGADQKLQVVVTPVSRGLSSPIALTVEGIPAGIVASFERDTLIPRGKEALSTNILLNAPSTSKPGIFPIRVSATTMGVSRIANASLNLRPSGDYSMRLDQATVSLNARGESRSVTLTIIPQGDFRATIDFSVTNLPPGMKASLSTTSATVQQETPITVVLTLTAQAEVQSGTYDLQIVANTGFSTKTINITVLVRSGTVEIWPVVLVVVILISVVSAIVFIGMPRGRQVRIVSEGRRLPP